VFPHARNTFTVVRAQTPAYDQKATHSNAWVALFSPSLSVHAIMGQQSAAAIHFLAHIWQYHEQPHVPQFPFLRKLDERTLTYAQLPNMSTRDAIVRRILSCSLAYSAAGRSSCRSNHPPRKIFNAYHGHRPSVGVRAVLRVYFFSG
jgi:hypothetical protein